MDLFAWVFLPWYLYLVVRAFKAGSGWSRILTAPVIAWLMAMYIPLLALEPAGVAFYKEIQRRLSDLD